MSDIDEFFGSGNEFIVKDEKGNIVPVEEEKSYAMETLSNVPASSKAFFKAVFMPVTDPVGFAKGMIGLGDSLLGLAGITDGDPDQAQAVGEHFTKRYGSVEGFQNAFKTDPIGILSDLSVVLTLGATAVAKGANVVGTASTIANSTKGSALVKAVEQGSTKTATVANLADPLMGSIAITQLPIVRNALAKGSNIVTAPLALATGKSINAIETAFDAGASGGKKQESFKNQFSGKGSPEELVNQAIAGLLDSKNAMQKTYNNGMTGLAMSQKIVPDFAGKLRAIKSNYMKQHMVFDAKLGKDVFRPPKGSEKFFKNVDDLIEQSINNTKNYTYGALDKLKKDIDLATPTFGGGGTKGATDAFTIRNDVKDLIVKEMPDYADVMKGYETANQVKTQIEKQLSLGTNIKEINNIDTTYRKLLSAMNDGVNANFGSRMNMVSKIDPDGVIASGLSGAQMNQALPSNISSRLLGGGLGLTGGAVNPLAFLTLPAFSPKLVGGGANLLGSGLRQAGNFAPLGSKSAFFNRNLTSPSLLAEPLTDKNALTYGMNQTKPLLSQIYKNSNLEDATNYLRGLLMGDS